MINRDNGETLRGPFRHQETAGAVRAEMERAYDNLSANLFVVRRPKEIRRNSLHPAVKSA